MSNIFANKQAATSGNIDEDFLGGGGLFESDIYTAVIKAAYMSKSTSSEATSVNLILNINNKECRQQIWVTNSKGEVTYKDKNSGDNKNLPGFNQITALSLLTVGKELGNLDVEDLVVKIYNFDEKKEIPTSVQCFPELHGQTVAVALQKQVVDKTVKNATTNSYETTGETREQNEIVKFFDNDKLVTISEVSEFIRSLGGDFNGEVKNGNILKATTHMKPEHAIFAEKWLEKNKGVTYNKAKGVGSSGGSKEFKSSSIATKKATTSLFD